MDSLLLKTIISVLVGLILRLFFVYHDCPVVIVSSIFCLRSFFVLPETKICVSSAYDVMEQFGKLRWKSAVKVMKRMGPRIEPWGTPASVVSMDDLIGPN